MSASIPILTRVGVLACIALAFALPPTVHSDSSPAELWEFRGKVALAGLGEIRAQLEPLREDDPAYKDLICISILETAYSFHEIAKERVHKMEGGKDYFHLALKGGAGEGLFDLLYAYLPNGTLSGVRIDRLPDGWTLMTSAKALQFMVVRPKSGACLFWFSVSDPFAAMATSEP